MCSLFWTGWRCFGLVLRAVEGFPSGRDEMTDSSSEPAQPSGLWPQWQPVFSTRKTFIGNTRKWALLCSTIRLFYWWYVSWPTSSAILTVFIHHLPLSPLPASSWHLLPSSSGCQSRGSQSWSEWWAHSVRDSQSLSLWVENFMDEWPFELGTPVQLLVNTNI